MHIKLIDPAKDGNKVYDNTGTVDRLVEYLRHEEKQTDQQELKDGAIFFNQTNENIKAQEVVDAINSNKKGLRKDEDKFDSLVISPSEDELKHIRNDPKMLIEYTRKVMENYVQNFNLKTRTKLESKDLVWYASVHTDREIKNIDIKGSSLLSEKEALVIERLKQENNPANDKKIEQMMQKAEERSAKKYDSDLFAVGDNKPGLNTHIHVIISRRDANQRITLNPRSTKERFPIKTFQEKSALEFNSMFAYEKGTISSNFYKNYSEQDKEKFNGKIFGLVQCMNHSLGQEIINTDQMQAIGERTNYSRVFFINMGKLKNEYQKGNTVLDPYFYAERGRDRNERDYDKQVAAERSNDYASQSMGKSVTSLLSTLAHINTGPAQLKESMYFDHERKKIKKHPVKHRDKGQAEHEID
jgi:hypothetical protein